MPSASRPITGKCACKSLVASAKPDGYTLAFTPNGPVTIQPHVIPTLAYKLESFVPLCQIFAVQYVLAVKPDSPFRTLADLMSAAKAKPGQVKYGYGGIATNPHLAMSQLVLVANVDLLAVPFRGDPQAILALKAGDVDAATMNIGGAKAQVNLSTVMQKRLVVTGSLLRPRSVEEKTAIARELEARVWPLLAIRHVAPILDRTLPLASAAEAHRLLEAGELVGKVVLLPEH